MSRKINDGLSVTERYRMRHRKKGLCLDCSRPVAPGRARCLTHLDRERRRYASMTTEAREAAAQVRKRKAKAKKKKAKKG